MNQIITQHGWGLDHNIWNKLKHKFIQKKWLWQDNERGYFSDSSIYPRWFEDNSDKSLRVALCHSLGTHLIKQKVLKEASHVVLINSFNNFIPTNHENKLTIKGLKRMEKKINPSEISPMLKEFIKKSFLPNEIDLSLKYIFDLEPKKINTNLLMIDFKKLFLQNQSINFFSEDTQVLIIKSKNDLILKEYACDEFIQMLNNSQINKPKLVELHKQGHLINNIDIVKIIEDWIKH